MVKYELKVINSQIHLLNLLKKFNNFVNEFNKIILFKINSNAYKNEIKLIFEYKSNEINEIYNYIRIYLSNKKNIRLKFLNEINFINNEYKLTCNKYWKYIIDIEISELLEIFCLIENHVYKNKNLNINKTKRFFKYKVHTLRQLTKNLQLRKES